jgi:23S rRNA pseudouridine1911/1915/1917 synthase
VSKTQFREISFTINKSQIGQRLDVFLAQVDPTISRSHVKCVIEEGDVLVNGKVPKVSQHLKEGDVIILTQRPPIEAAAVAQEMPLDIVYEDEAIIVINKPAGMVVHPAPGNADKTLVNALLFHCHDLSGIGGVLRPGIVHRLDKDTSGLIVAAKSDDTHRHLSAQFEKHDVHKKYLALVWGDVKGNHGEIVLPVGRHTTNRKKCLQKANMGKTRLLSGKCWNAMAWLLCWRWRLKPDAPIKFACICLIAVIRLSAMPSMATPPKSTLLKIRCSRRR